MNPATRTESHLRQKVTQFAKNELDLPGHWNILEVLSNQHMKTLPLFALLVLAAVNVQAAPALQPADLSEETLLQVANARQKASIESYNKAVERAERDREKSIKQAQKLTEKNDAGLKKTIQRRQLNTMLPASERAPETPRKSPDYTVRY